MVHLNRKNRVVKTIEIKKGAIIVVCLALYWIPKTSSVGFLLLCSFGGGMIVAEIVAGHMPIPGIMLSSMVYVGTILRKPSILG